MSDECEDLNPPVGAIIKHRLEIFVEVPSWNKVLSQGHWQRLKFKNEIKDIAARDISCALSAIENA